MPKPASASNPTTISFQGKVVNSNGTNVTDGTYSFVFKLYTVSSGGSAIWTETDSSVSVTSGVFQVNLGASCPFFTANACNSSTPIDFNANNSLYLGITFNSDPAGEMSPRVQLQSVPYAFNSDKVGGLTVSQLVQLSPGSQQSGNINVSGTGTFGSTLTVGSLPAATTATYVCYNASNQLANCNTTGNGAAFVQGGNNFGATAVLGTTAANSLELGTYNGTALQQRLLITNTTASANNSTLTFNGLGIFSPTADSASAFQVQNQAGTATVLNVDTTNTGAVTLAGVAPASVASGNGTAASTILTVTGPAGGAVSASTGNGGVGSALSLNGGAGGAITGSGSGTGGTGGSFTLQAGNGGNAVAAGTNGNGGNITISAGAAGSGAGAAGSAGSVSIQGGGGINIGTANAANTIQIGNGAGGSAIAQTIDIGNNNNAGSTDAIGIGSTVGTSGTTIEGGTNNINLLPNGTTNTGVIIKPFNGSTSTLNVKTPGNNSVLDVDTTNSFVGIGTAGPTAQLSISGANLQPTAASTGTNASNVITVLGAFGGNGTSTTNGTTAGSGAAVSVTAGSGGNETGASGNTIAGTGGAVTLSAGNGGLVTSTTGTEGTGGSFTIQGGNAANLTNVAQTVATGGGVTVQGGNGSNGTSTSANGNGGTLTLQGGAAGTGGSGNGNGGTLTLDSGANVNSGTSTVNLGITNATSIVVGSSTGAISLNGNTTIAANRSLTFTSGSGTFTQNYSNNVAGAAHPINLTNTNSGAGITMQGISITPTNTTAASSGTNLLNIVNFAAGGALLASDNTNGINFASATGYTNFILTPTFKLTSAGVLSTPTVNATTGYQANGTAGAGVSCTAGNYVNTEVVKEGILTSTSGCSSIGLSDQRLKTDIVSLQAGSLDLIKNVNPVSFYFDCTNTYFASTDTSCDPTLQTGVIAQQLMQLFPDLVTQDQWGYYHVNYQGLSIENLEATKELAQYLDSSGNANLNNVTASNLTTNNLTVNNSLTYASLNTPTGNFSSSVNTPLVTSSAGLAIDSGGANNLSLDTGASGAGVDIGSVNADQVSLSQSGHITTVNGGLSVDQDANFSGGVTTNFSGGKSLAITSDLSGDNNVISINAQPATTSGTKNAVSISQTNNANSNGLTSAIAIDNASNTTPIGSAISVTNSGGAGFKTAINTPGFSVSGSGDVITEGSITDKSGSFAIVNDGGQQTVTIDSSGNANFSGSVSFSSATATGGISIGGDLSVAGLSTFQKLATFIAKTVFQQDVEFDGHISVSSDSAGYASLRPGESSVHVAFKAPYANPPVVTANITNGQYAALSVNNVTTAGFDINLQTPALNNTTLSWTAIGVINPVTSTNVTASISSPPPASPTTN